VENLLKSEAAFLTSLNIAVEVTHSKMICCTKVGCFIGLLMDQLEEHVTNSTLFYNLKLY